MGQRGAINDNKLVGGATLMTTVTSSDAKVLELCEVEEIETEIEEADKIKS